MGRRSLAEYLNLFLGLGRECAYVQKRGYRIERWTYRQVAETAFQIARELRRQGINRGDRVLIWGRNSAEWVSAFFGCALYGAVIVPMDDSAAADFAVRVAHQVNAKLLFCSQEHGQASTMPKIILDDLHSALADLSSAEVAVPDLGHDDTLEIVFTSGTTAEPKGVVITHGNVLANVGPFEAEIPKYDRYEFLVHPIRFLNLLPLSHVFGQFLGMFLPSLLRATVVFQDSVKPAEVIGTIHRERVSVLVCVPRMLQSLREKVERELEDGELESFRKQFQAAAGKHFLRRWWTFRRLHRQFGWRFWAFVCGGATLDQATEEFWRRLGFAVIQGYGLTETTSLISVNHPFRLGKGSIGKVLAGREIKLAPDGEILVRGSGVAAGYWGGEQQSVRRDDGWYATGDIGELDAQGNLYFKGRKKDVIVTPAGMNVYPEDLETALRQQPEVKDCIVVPLPREGNAEPCAVLVLRAQADAREIVGRANQRLAEYQRMRAWFVWPEQDFPRTSTQKPRRSAIGEMVLKYRGEKSEDHKQTSALAELIARATGRARSSLSSEASLESDLNLTSLDRVELLEEIEQRYQLDLSEAQFAAIHTVGDLERVLDGDIPARVRFHYPDWVQGWPVTWLRFLTNYLLLFPAILVLGWPRIKGREHLRNVSGPVLVICNHISHVDVGFVLMALPGHLRHRLATAAGGEALEALRTPAPGRSVWGRIYDRLTWTLGVSLLNLFPLPRQAGFRESFAYAGSCIDRGYSVLVFPEGRHTTDGKMNPFRAGIGLLANNLAVPIVPMRIDGLFELKRASKKVAKPGEIRVKIGEPLRLGPNSEPEKIARELEDIVERL